MFSAFSRIFFSVILLDYAYCIALFIFVCIISRCARNRTLTMLREKEAQKQSLLEDMETVRKRKLAEQEMGIREERQKRQQEIEMERSASKNRRQQMLEEAERKEQERIQQREDQEDKLQCVGLENESET